MSQTENRKATVPAWTAQNIGIEVFAGRDQPHGAARATAFSGGRAVILIAAGARLPAARAMTFTTVSDRQRAIEVRVVRCTADARPSGMVGRFLLPGLCDGARGEARIDIGLSLDLGGVLRAWASDRATGARQEASFAGLWALGPELRPDACSQLARGVDAGIDRLPRGAQAALRTDRDEAEQRARAGGGIHRGGEPAASADYATALATLAGEIDARAGRRELADYHRELADYRREQFHGTTWEGAPKTGRETGPGPRG